MRGHACVITRLRLEAALYKPAPPCRKGQRGRSRPKGDHLPPLKTVRDSKKTAWTRVVVSQWYNAQQRTLLTATGTALWYKTGVAPVPIRRVLVRDPTGEHEPAAFLSTDLKAAPAMILGWFVTRWRVETTFQEVRTHLGVETQREWSDRAISGKWSKRNAARRREMPGARGPSRNSRLPQQQTRTRESRHLPRRECCSRKTVIS